MIRPRRDTCCGGLLSQVKRKDLWSLWGFFCLDFVPLVLPRSVVCFFLSFSLFLSLFLFLSPKLFPCHLLGWMGFCLGIGGRPSIMPRFLSPQSQVPSYEGFQGPNQPQNEPYKRIQSLSLSCHAFCADRLGISLVWCPIPTIQPVTLKYAPIARFNWILNTLLFFILLLFCFLYSVCLTLSLSLSAITSVSFHCQKWNTIRYRQLSLSLSLDKLAIGLETGEREIEGEWKKVRKRERKLKKERKRE